ncbi:hypothetical protein AVEN_20338-1 [Araneus ventricosus]|uniref:Uncharacterized protein n=1 Tax=Araneus ventricosus TaxID=182803 RepID=A0A4Y2IRK5_ARAVE|nr:hypothetical protein AVEN_20338-1 [Araneus ventricosus]
MTSTKPSPRSSFGAASALGRVVELCRRLTTMLRSADCCIHSIFYIACPNASEEWIVVVAQNKRRAHFITTINFIFSQFMRQTFVELFWFSKLLELLDDLSLTLRYLRINAIEAEVALMRQDWRHLKTAKSVAFWRINVTEATDLAVAYRVGGF